MNNLWVKSLSAELQGLSLAEAVGAGLRALDTVDPGVPTDPVAPAMLPGLASRILNAIPPEARDPQRVSEFVTFFFLSARDPTLRGWHLKAKAVATGRLYQSITHCYSHFVSGDGLFKVDTTQDFTENGLVLGFDRVAELEEVSPWLLAQQILELNLHEACGCSSRVEPREAARSREKCLQGHRLSQWLLVGTWKEITLWQFLDRAALGFYWPMGMDNKRDAVSFRRSGFHGSMLAMLLDRWLTKLNVVRYFCPKCRLEKSKPCQENDCPLAAGSMPLPMVGRKEFVALRATGHCQKCGRLLSEDELGRACPGADGHFCASRQYVLGPQFFRSITLWRCAECSKNFHGERFFVANNCLFGCGKDIVPEAHDGCPACPTTHKPGPQFRKCYWHMFNSDGLSPALIPPPARNKRLHVPIDAGEEITAIVEHGSLNPGPVADLPFFAPPEKQRGEGAGKEEERGTAEVEESMQEGGAGQALELFAGDQDSTIEDDGSTQDELALLQADLSEALMQVAAQFEDWRATACVFFAEDVVRALPFFYFAGDRTGSGVRPTEHDYTLLFQALIARPAVRAEFVASPAALKDEWENRSGPLVTTFLQYYLARDGKQPAAPSAP